MLLERNLYYYSEISVGEWLCISGDGLCCKYFDERYNKEVNASDQYV
jgi:hypothetical protein